MKILLVDDENCLLQSFAYSLKKKQHIVEMAEDGEKAWQLYHKDPKSFDLIITDLKMPKFSGDTLVQKLREQGFSTPVILMSGHIDSKVTSSAKELGVSHVLIKPFDMAEVFQILDKYRNKE